MKKDELYSKLMGNSIPTYYKWLKQRRSNNGMNNKRLILKLLDDYFTHDELTEYINTHTIKKFDKHNYLFEMEISTLLPQAKNILIKSGDFFTALDVLDILKKLKNRYVSLQEEHRISGDSRLEGKFEEIGDHEIDEYVYLCGAVEYKKFNIYIVDIIFNNASLVEEYTDRKLSPFNIYHIQNTILEISKKHLEEVILNHFKTIHNDFTLSLERKEKLEQEYLLTLNLQEEDYLDEQEIICPINDKLDL